MMASSPTDNTEDFASVGPVGRSLTELRFFHLATIFWLMPLRWESALRLLLTVLFARRTVSVIVALP